MVIVHLIIPKQRLVTISPEKVLDTDVLVGKLNLFLGKRSMGFMIVMFRIQLPSIEERD
jgi:hypothetical protein